LHKTPDKQGFGVILQYVFVALFCRLTADGTPQRMLKSIIQCKENVITYFIHAHYFGELNLVITCPKP